MERATFEEILQDLEQFLQLCSSIGLQDKRGRFTQYRHKIVDLITAVKTHSLSDNDEELQQYRIALMEATEVCLLLPYLQQCDSKDIILKLKDCLSGSFMPIDETSKSNHPRNIQFELFLARTLWRSGFQPVLGEHPDLKCQVENKWLFFECKRLFSTSPQTLRDRIHEAANQIRKNRRKAPPGTRGIIAISLSRVFNPTQTARPTPNEYQGRVELDTWLKNKAEEVRGAWEPLANKKIVGIIFYAASAFKDLDAGLYTSGRFSLGISLARAGSPDDITVKKLAEAMEATQY